MTVRRRVQSTVRYPVFLCKHFQLHSSSLLKHRPRVGRKGKGREGVRQRLLHVKIPSNLSQRSKLPPMYVSSSLLVLELWSKEGQWGRLVDRRRRGRNGSHLPESVASVRKQNAGHAHAQSTIATSKPEEVTAPSFPPPPLTQLPPSAAHLWHLTDN